MAAEAILLEELTTTTAHGLLYLFSFFAAATTARKMAAICARRNYTKRRPEGIAFRFFILQKLVLPANLRRPYGVRQNLLKIQL